MAAKTPAKKSVTRPRPAPKAKATAKTAAKKTTKPAARKAVKPAAVKSAKKAVKTAAKPAVKPAVKKIAKPAAKKPADRAAAPKRATAASATRPAKTVRTAKSAPAKETKPARTTRGTPGTKSAKSVPAARSTPRPKTAAAAPAPGAPGERPRKPAAPDRSRAAGSGAAKRAGADHAPAPVTRDLAAYRASLFALREATLAAYRNEIRLGQEASDEPTEDIVDRANNAYTRELSFSISDAERTRLLQIEAALARIEQGTFGRCGHCGREIPEPRLQILPWAYLCVDCQDLLEKGLLVDA